MNQYLIISLLNNDEKDIYFVINSYSFNYITKRELNLIQQKIKLIMNLTETLVEKKTKFCYLDSTILPVSYRLFDTISDFIQRITISCLSRHSRRHYS